VSKAQRIRNQRAAAAARAAGLGSRRSRRSIAGFAFLIAVVAAAAVVGVVLARNNGTRNISVGGQQVNLPARTSSSTGGTGLGRAPNFSIRTLTGATFRLLPTRAPVVISFFAGWCGSCLQEARADGQVARTFGPRGVRVIEISADPNDSVTQIEQFIAAAGNPPIAWAWDRQGAVTIPYRVTYLDTTVVVNRQGRIVYRDEYPTPYGTLARVLGRITR